MTEHRDPVTHHPPYERRRFRVAAHKNKFIPDEVEADRDARKELRPRDLTAQLLGDPLPGYSALDRRRT